MFATKLEWAIPGACMRITLALPGLPHPKNDKTYSYERMMVFNQKVMSLVIQFFQPCVQIHLVEGINLSWSQGAERLKGSKCPMPTRSQSPGGPQTSSS